MSPAREDHRAGDGERRDRLAEAQMLLRVLVRAHVAKALAREIGVSEATNGSWHHGARAASRRGARVARPRSWRRCSTTAGWLD
jgi:hypothetical protein